MSSNTGGMHNRTGYTNASPAPSPKMPRSNILPAPAPAPVIQPGSMPSDDQLLTEIRNILATADLMTLTKKQVRESLSTRFGGIDLKPKREVINKMIDNVLKGM